MRVINVLTVSKTLKSVDQTTVHNPKYAKPSANMHRKAQKTWRSPALLFHKVESLSPWEIYPGLVWTVTSTRSRAPCFTELDISICHHLRLLNKKLGGVWFSCAIQWWGKETARQGPCKLMVSPLSTFGPLPPRFILHFHLTTKHPWSPDVEYRKLRGEMCCPIQRHPEHTYGASGGSIWVGY